MGVGGHHCDPVDVHDEMTEVASVRSLTIIQRLSSVCQVSEGYQLTGLGCL